MQPEVFRARVAQALAGPGWVADGNYHRVRDLVWGRAAALAWLDYPLLLVLWRLARPSPGLWARGDWDRAIQREP